MLSRIESTWYPAPGYRGTANGTLYYVGYGGYSRASSVSGSNAYYLNFRNNFLNPQNAYYRAEGLQVRCLQE